MLYISILLLFTDFVLLAIGIVIFKEINHCKKMIARDLKRLNRKLRKN